LGRGRAGLLILLILAALASLSCGASSPSSVPTHGRPTASQGGELIATTVVVELDIFSGRPNPTWTLSDTDRAHLLEQLARLPAASAAEFDTNLGYRGFIVRMANAAETSVVRIQRGKVDVSAAGRDLYSSDPKRGMERWLLRTGQPSLDPTVYGVVEGELSR
jgi:hypothetical protein